MNCAHCDAILRKAEERHCINNRYYCGACFWELFTTNTQSVILKLTPGEAEQTLRALNQAGMVGAPPYFNQSVLMDSATRLTNAMTEAGIDHSKPAHEEGDDS